MIESLSLPKSRIVPARCFTLIFLNMIVFSTGSAPAQVPDAERERAIAAIKKAGGMVYFGPDQEIASIAMSSPRVTDDELPLLQAFPELRVLDLNYSQVTDAGLKHLKELQHLEEIYLKETSVTARGVEAFKAEHPSVFIVEVSPTFRPERLLFAALLFPLVLLGSWLVRTSVKKRDVLAWHVYRSGLGVGVFLIVLSLVLMTVAVMQSLGVDVTLSNLFD